MYIGNALQSVQSIGASRLKQVSTKIQSIMNGAANNLVSNASPFLAQGDLANISRYTRDDAIMRQWEMQRPQVTLQDVMNQTFKPSDVFGSPQKYAELREQLESKKQCPNGLFSSAIGWNYLTSDLNRCCLETAFGIDLSSFSLDNSIDKLTARYSAAEFIIKKHGDVADSETQLARLDEIMQVVSKDIAKSFSDGIASFFAENKVSGYEQEINVVYNSVLQAIEERKSAYRNMLADGSIFRPLKGKQDEWLLDDDAYVASILQTAERMPEIVSARNSSIYTADELRNLGDFVCSLQRMEQSVSAFSTDELQVGLDFAFLSMKVDTLSHSDKICSRLSQLFQKTVAGYMETLLDRHNTLLSTRRDSSNKNFIAADTKGYAQFDGSVVWSIYDVTMQTYNNTGNVLSALQSGGEYGRNLFYKCAADMDGVYRYNNKDFWNSFFKDNTGNGQMYTQAGSTINNYISNWLDFINSMNRDRLIRFNFDIRSASEYNISSLINITA